MSLETWLKASTVKTYLSLTFVISSVEDSEHIKEFNLFKSYKKCSSVIVELNQILKSNYLSQWWKLDGVGPVDNRPSTD